MQKITVAKEFHSESQYLLNEIERTLFSLGLFLSIGVILIKH